MSQLVAAIGPLRSVGAEGVGVLRTLAAHRGTLRWAALAVILVFALAAGDAGRVVAETLSEAYLAVTVFVVGTLVLLRGLEVLIRRDVGELLMSLRAWQVPAAALLGAFPGCGGAIVIVTQYARGTVGFGALVATLISTMGDAMFLLLAKEPSTGLLVPHIGVLRGSFMA